MLGLLKIYVDHNHFKDRVKSFILIPQLTSSVQYRMTEGRGKGLKDTREDRVGRTRVTWGCRSCRALQTTIKMLDFILIRILSHWRILSRGLAWSDLYFYNRDHSGCCMNNYRQKVE